MSLISITLLFIISLLLSLSVDDNAFESIKSLLSPLLSSNDNHLSYETSMFSFAYRCGSSSYVEEVEQWDGHILIEHFNYLNLENPKQTFTSYRFNLQIKTTRTMFSFCLTWPRTWIYLTNMC
jgi:hypothetical protein